MAARSLGRSEGLESLDRLVSSYPQLVRPGLMTAAAAAAAGHVIAAAEVDHLGCSDMSADSR